MVDVNLRSTFGARFGGFECWYAYNGTPISTVREAQRNLVRLYVGCAVLPGTSRGPVAGQHFGIGGKVVLAVAGPQVVFLVRLQVCAERPQGVGYGAVLRLQVLGTRGYLFDVKSPTCSPGSRRSFVP